MATWDAPLNLPGPIHHRRFARNGSLVQANYYRLIAAAQNHAFKYRRKCFCNFSQALNAIDGGSAGSDVPLWRTWIATGYGVDHIEVNLILIRPNTHPGSDPLVYVKLLNPTTGATIETSAVVHTGVTTDTDDGPDRWIHVTLTLDAVDVTVYWLQSYASDYGRIVAMEAHEVAGVVDDTVVGAIDPRCAVDSPIYDARMSSLAVGQTGLLKNTRRHLDSWSAYGTSSISNATTTYKNILDGTSTAVAAASPGIRLQNAYCNTASRTAVPVIFAVYAVATVDGGYAKITDGTNELETGLITTEGWYYVAGTLPASPATHYDVWQKAAAGSEITTSAAVLLEVE